MDGIIKVEACEVKGKQFATLNKAIDRIVGNIDELKRLDITRVELLGTVSEDIHVFAVVGAPNDENNALRLCRTIYSFSIGPRGGLYTFNGKGGRVNLKIWDLFTKACI